MLAEPAKIIPSTKQYRYRCITTERFFPVFFGGAHATQFFQSCPTCMMEKMQLTLKNSTEFQELTNGQQKLVLERNSTLALYFTQAKLELAKVRKMYSIFNKWKKIFSLFKKSHNILSHSTCF